MRLHHKLTLFIFLLTCGPSVGGNDRTYHSSTLSRRNFGGDIPIDFPRVINAIFGAGGWLSSAVEVVTDIIFHISGYTILGITYNFGEPRIDPDPSRQLYLDQFFGPTALATSGFRAIRNPSFNLFLRTTLNLIFTTEDMVGNWSTIHLNNVTNLLLGEAYLYSKIFRDVCTLYFTSVGWSTLYLVYKWSVNQPIIAGRKKRKRETTNFDSKLVEQLLEETFQKIIENFGHDNGKNKPSDSKFLLDLSSHGLGQNLTLIGSDEKDRRFGDYQYYMSFGGDQYMDVIAAIDNVFGTSGIAGQLSHTISQITFEFAGYTAMGFMYNGFYRKQIEDEKTKLFLDAFVGTNAVIASATRIIRNGSFSFITRSLLIVFLPLTRNVALTRLRNLSFGDLKKVLFSQLFLHQRIFRHLFETGVTLCGSSTFYMIYKIRKAFMDNAPTVKRSDAKLQGQFQQVRPFEHTTAPYRNIYSSVYKKYFP